MTKMKFLRCSNLLKKFSRLRKTASDSHLKSVHVLGNKLEKSSKLCLRRTKFFLLARQAKLVSIFLMKIDQQICRVSIHKIVIRTKTFLIEWGIFWICLNRDLYALKTSKQKIKKEKKKKKKEERWERK